MMHLTEMRFYKRSSKNEKNREKGKASRKMKQKKKGEESAVKKSIV